jgi:hypothetical protein
MESYILRQKENSQYNIKTIGYIKGRGKMTKKTTKTKKKLPAKPKDKSDEILEREIKKLGTTKLYVDSEDDPDQFKDYPLIVVCKANPKDYIYPVMMKLETSNIVRLTAMNKYISTVLRIIELYNWCLDVRIKRKRQMNHIETGKTLIVNEYVLEKIPACRN